MGAIYDEAAYEAAIHRNIISNARKTWEAKTPRADEIVSALADGREYRDYGASFTYAEGFMGKMAWAFDTFGKLTEGQSAAILKGIDARAAKRAEWAKKNAEENAASVHVGEVGKRVELTLSCYHEIKIEGSYGVSWVHLCKDPDNNIVVYIGNSHGFPMKGETKVVKATIKEHSVRDSVKQTVIARPKVISTGE